MASAHEARRRLKDTMAKKNCFMNAARPCDLTCKAAFEVDDPVDNVDCQFVWLAFHFGESLVELRKTLDMQAGTASNPSAGPKGPKGFPFN
jgi:hypothetical protein